MPLFTASVLTTLGLSVISGAIKCAGGGSLGGAMLGTIDGIFGDVLGGVCGDQFNQLRDSIQASPDIEQNADVERCSIDALLRALITFSEAAKQHVSRTEQTRQEQEDYIHFLTEAQKHFNKRLAKLDKLPDTDPVLNQNPLTQGDTLARVLAKHQTERIAAMKVELTNYALQEFNYSPENKLYQQLAVWLPQGLPGGQHWFVYYIHALHANLKKDNPQYCKDARRILTQQQLADISLVTQASLAQLDGLMTRTAEMHALMATVYDVVVDMHSVVVGLKEQMDRLERHSVQHPDPTVFPQYDDYQRQLAEKDKAFASIQQDLEKWQPRLAQADELAAELLQEKIAKLENQRLTIGQERQQIRDDLADFERSVQALAQLLSPDDPEKDSALLRQARERYDAGDFSGTNEVLSEANIDGMIARAEAKRQEADLIDQKAAQAFLAKANALAGAKPDANWLNEAIRFCKRAVEIYADKNTFFAAAYFLQTYNQFTDAIGLYQRVLSVELAFEEKASTLNNLAALLAGYPDEHGLAKQYHEEALGIRRQLALSTPGAYALNLAQTLVGFSVFYIQSAPNKEQSMALAREAYDLLTPYQAVPLANSLADVCQQIAAHWEEEL